MKHALIFGTVIALVACSSSKTKNGGSAGGGQSGSAQSGASGGGGAAPSGTGGKSTSTGSGGKATTTSGSGGKASSASGGTSSATGGANSATGGAGSTTTSTGASVLERNNHPNRDGLFVQPMLTKAAAAKMAIDASFKANFNGAMWASPLYLENGPNGQGVFFAVTTGNDVFALDETTGATTWMHNIGSSPTANGVSCGSIHPLGIISTPVIDANARTIFVAGAIGTSSIMRHEVHALSVDDGKERSGWPLDVTKLSSGSVQFMAPPHNQRSALSLVNGVVYVAYGGHVGDCGSYHGWVIGVNSSDPTKAGAWATLGDRGEGIWAAGGMASDGNGVFAITGNSTSGASDHSKSDSEEVVRITGLGTLTRNDANLYYPAHWQMMDSQDADFGASNPIVIDVAGATPSKFVVAIAKDGHFYLLDPANLGGMAGHKVDFMVANAAMSIHTAPAAYTTSKGVHVVFSTDGSAQCPAGGASGKVIMSVLIPAGAPPAPSVAWCTALTGAVTSPIVTTTDGKSEAMVWFLNNGNLTAVDGDTGAAVWKSTDSCSNVRQWTSPIAVKGRIVVGGDGHLCSWSPH